MLGTDCLRLVVIIKYLRQCSAAVYLSLSEWNNTMRVVFEQASWATHQLPGMRIAFWLYLPALMSGKGGLSIPCLETNCACSLHTLTHTSRKKHCGLYEFSCAERQALTVLLKGSGLCMLWWPWGSFHFHHWGQPLSESVFLPRGLSAIHHVWWMGNEEASPLGFKALYQFW